MNKPAVTFVKSRSRIQNQTEVTAVNHNGELGWISGGSTWTNCTERGNKRNQMTLESVLEQSIQIKTFTKFSLSGRTGTDILHESGTMVVAKIENQYDYVPINSSFLEE